MRAVSLLLTVCLLAIGGCASMPLSPAEEVTASLANPRQPWGDRPRQGYKPPLALNLATFGPGTTLADLFTGGAYGEAISQWVGPKAEVRLGEKPGDGGATKPAPAAPITGPATVHYEYQSPSAMNLGKSSLDGALMVAPYAGLFESTRAPGRTPADVGQFIEQVVTALKSGGVLLVVEKGGAVVPGSDRTRKPRDGVGSKERKAFEAHGLDFIGSVPTQHEPEAAGGNKARDRVPREKDDNVIDMYRKP
jgi:predicted methyltransferase